MTTLHLCLLLLTLSFQETEKPLPKQTSFLEEFRRTLNNPQKLLSQYTYTETETEITLDSKGRPKKTETNVYQVVNGAEEWQTYERKISKNGVPLTAQELEKQDRKERERIQKEMRNRAKWSEEKKRQEKAKTEREERESNDDVFAAFDYELVRRETVGGASTILLNFKPKKNYKPKTSDGRDLHHFAGRLWISEDDHEIAKLEAEAVDTIKFGAGLLAKLQKGSTFKLEMRKVNDEIWLPVKVDVAVNGRVLLLMGLKLHLIVEFSDHKKFNVDTILEFKEISN